MVCQRLLQGAVKRAGHYCYQPGTRNAAAAAVAGAAAAMPVLGWAQLLLLHLQQQHRQCCHACLLQGLLQGLLQCLLLQTAHLCLQEAAHLHHLAASQCPGAACWLVLRQPTMQGCSC
jgi:hypothetical protein